MNNEKTSQTTGSSADSRLIALMDEIHQKLIAGKTVDVEEYIQHLPQHEEAIRKCAATMKAIAVFGETLDGDSQAMQRTELTAKQIGCPPTPVLPSETPNLKLDSLTAAISN